MIRTRAWVVAAAVVLSACDHTAPFSVENPEALGPWEGVPPIRLTFNPGDDRHPAANGAGIVYSRMEPQRADHDRCLAVLPPGGGTLVGLSCAGGTHADSMVDAWIEPALSDDGRVAYIRDHSRLLAWGPTTRRLSVAPLHAPDSIIFEASVLFWLEDGTRVTAMRQLSWTLGGAVRFVAGEESYPRVDTLPDTLFTAYAVAELSLETGGFRLVPGTDGAFTYAVAPDGGIWFVTKDAPHQLLHVPSNGGTAVPVAVFSGPVAWVTTVGDRPLGVRRGTDRPTVEWLDPDSGGPVGTMVAPGAVNRVAGIAGTRRFVAEVVSGTSTDLWILDLP